MGRPRKTTNPINTDQTGEEAQATIAAADPAPAAPTEAACDPPAAPVEAQPPGAVEATQKKPTKIQVVVTLLRRPEGASIAELQDATGWQGHSVRGALAGSIKKALGLNVTSEKTDGVRVYRITDTAHPCAGTPAACEAPAEGCEEA